MDPPRVGKGLSVLCAVLSDVVRRMTTSAVHLDGLTVINLVFGRGGSGCFSRVLR